MQLLPRKDLFLIFKYLKRQKVMKKVIVLLLIGIGFICMESTNVKFDLLTSFLGGCGVGFAVLEARLLGRKEGREEL